MSSPTDVRRYRQNLQAEVDSATQYRAMAAAESDPKIASVYRRLAAVEERALMRELGPTYHFCGHYHEPGVRLSAPDGTHSYELNAVGFSKPARLNPGCIGILRWASPSDHAFTLLDEPWLAEYTKWSYRAL